jgi:flagellar hook protein FlgE
VLYDSLGIAHNLGFTWVKSASNQWNIQLTPAAGSAVVTLDDSAGAPYASAGRLDFSAQPSDGDTIVIDGVTYEFDSDASVVDVPGTLRGVTIGTDLATTLGDLVANWLLENPADTRLTQGAGTDNDTIFFTQSAAGAAVAFDASGTTVVDQSSAFTVPALTASTPAITFAGDGTPASFNVASMDVTWTTGANPSTGIALDLGTAGLGDGLTQFSGVFATNFIQQNGVPFGIFNGVSISNDGIVSALFDNGEVRAIYQIPIATFSNPNALGGRTGNVYQATNESGDPLINLPGIGPAGKVNAGALEASTVDLAEEFTKMIISQRAFSATSKVITTSDEMLDELVRIKR